MWNKLHVSEQARRRSETKLHLLYDVIDVCLCVAEASINLGNRFSCFGQTRINIGMYWSDVSEHQHHSSKAGNYSLSFYFLFVKIKRKTHYLYHIALTLIIKATDRAILTLTLAVIVCSTVW